MMRRLALVTLCLLIQGAGHCYGRQQTIYINPGTGSPTLEGYAKKNTTVYWKVLDPSDSFQVEFTGKAPCQPSTDKDVLKAYSNHSAQCKIKLPKGYKTGEVLRFQYQILHTPNRPDDQQHFFQHVGSCDPCTDSPAGPQVANSMASTTPASAPTYLPIDYWEDLSCTSPYIDPNPSLPVHVTDVIYWENPNGAAHPTWTIQFDSATACKVAPTFKDPSCKVSATPSSTPYTYHVVVGNGISPGCKFDGSITVSASPAH